MKLIIDIPEEEYELIVNDEACGLHPLTRAVANGTPLSDNATNGKEILIKYCLEHSGEEIYDLLNQISKASMSWTDSRGFFIDWLDGRIQEVLSLIG